MPILVRRRTLGFVDIDGTQKQKEMEETSKQEGNRVDVVGAKDTLFGGEVDVSKDVGRER